MVVVGYSENRAGSFQLLLQMPSATELLTECDKVYNRPTSLISLSWGRLVNLANKMEPD